MFLIGGVHVHQYFENCKKDLCEIIRGFGNVVVPEVDLSKVSLGGLK